MALFRTVPLVRSFLGASLLFGALAAGGAEESLPDGFEYHGVAAPTGRQIFGEPGSLATTGPDGRRVVFLKLWAGSESSYLFIDAETGETEQIYPGIGGRGGWPLIISGNKVYDTMGNWFLEIDVSTREVRRVGQIPSGMALGYAMDKEGVIYAGIYPTGTLVSYNPATGEYVDYGRLKQESWDQYLRPMAVGGDGWVYIGIGQKLSQVIGFNPATRETRYYLPEEDRVHGTGRVFLGTDGKVYANADGWSWHVMSDGVATAIEKPPVSAVPLTNYTFPDGSRVTQLDVANRRLRILDAGADGARDVSFDYESPGVRIYTVVAGPDGKIYGATGVPLRIWRFDPATGRMDDRGLAGHTGHVNDFALQGSKLYGAVYSSGSLIEFDPAQPYHDTSIRQSRNPRHLHGFEYGHQGSPDMFGRPYVMFAHPDGKHVIMGGNPARVLVGGGMLIYNIETGEEIALKPEDLLPDQGVMALGALPNGDLIVGSTTVAATAGTSGANAAKLYRLDWRTREVTGRWLFEPPVASVRDLLVGETGLVYGMASRNRFFVFDPERGEFLHDEQVTAYGADTGGQAPRVMAFAPDDGIYVIFRDAIARFDLNDYSHREVARPGVPITAGIAVHEGRLYFASEGRLYSYRF